MSVPVISEEIRSMRRELKRIRSMELAALLLISVPFLLSIQELCLRAKAVHIPLLYYWLFVFLAVGVAVFQWMKYTGISARFKRSDAVPQEFASDFFQIAVWEPRILIFTLCLFMSAVYLTGMLGDQGEISMRYAVIPGGVAVMASSLRGYLRARGLTSRILNKYYRQGIDSVHRSDEA